MMNSVCITLDICGAIIILLGAYCVYTGTDGTQLKYRLLKTIIWTLLFGAVSDMMTYVVSTMAPGGILWNMLQYFAILAMQTWLCLISFYRLCFVRERKLGDWKVGWIGACVSIATFIFATIMFAFGALFWCDNGTFVAKTPYYIIGFLDILIILFYCINCVLDRKIIGKEDTIALFVQAFLPVAAYGIEFIFPGLYCMYFTMSTSIIFSFVNIQQHEMRDRAQALEDQNSRLQALANIYLTMHIIDLEKDTFVEFNSTDNVRNQYAENGSAAATMASVIRHTIVPNQIEMALAFTDLTTVAERLGGSNTLSAELLSTDMGWFRGRFIVIDRDAKGMAKNVIYATVVVQAEKTREEGLIHISRTDELTQVNNRHAYEEAIHILDMDKNKNVFIVSLDINGLKVINDTLGHAAGDEMIKGASHCMVEAFGEYGDIYRTGGDEFAILLTCDEPKAKQMIEDFSHKVQEWKGKKVKKLSVSYGYVQRSEFPRKNMEQLISIADTRMYEMKGRFYEETGIDRRRRYQE